MLFIIHLLKALRQEALWNRGEGPLRGRKEEEKKIFTERDSVGLALLVVFINELYVKVVT